MAEINWRDLFAKYVEVVGKNEGVDFLYRSEWPDDEWEAIATLMHETGQWPEDYEGGR